MIGLTMLTRQNLREHSASLQTGRALITDIPEDRLSSWEPRHPEEVVKQISTPPSEGELSRSPREGGAGHRRRPKVTPIKFFVRSCRSYPIILNRIPP